MCSRWIAGCAAIGVMLVLAAPRLAQSATSAASTPPEIVQALKGLKKANAADRQKVYELISLKGDAQLIPALRAYKDGSLQLIGDHLAIYGQRVTLPDKGSVLPLIDALTGQPIKGDDGQPVYQPRPDLSNAMRAPPRSEKMLIADLISSLALLDPDPTVRLESIRDVGERAPRAFIDSADRARLIDVMSQCSAVLKGASAQAPASLAAAFGKAAAELDTASSQRPNKLLSPAPDSTAVAHVKAALRNVQDLIAPGLGVSARQPIDPKVIPAVTSALAAASSYQDRIEAQEKTLDDLRRYSTALKMQLGKDPSSRFAPALKESIAELDLVLGDQPTRLAAARQLGEIDTSRAAILLRKVVEASKLSGDTELEKVAAQSLSSAESYQARVHFVQNTFAGLSLSSILILLALGLSIIFGLMGVINMAQGEFMMLGAFTTYVVSEAFRQYLPPGAYDYYPIAAVPAAFFVAGAVGYVVEALVIRHLYGRPLDSLLATWGIGLILIWAVRRKFGDNLSVRPPHWMEGGVELGADMVFPLNRIYIILFCVICIGIVYLLVNRTKLGLLLRATTQNREMAAALGVATRRVDGLTFAFGTGLAGLAGVVVPLYNKINPNIGQEYIVDSFMVVVTGGVGKLAGVIWSGLGLGFLAKYLEPLLGSFSSLSSSSSVLGKVLVLLLIIAFLQKRPSGLFPPKGRTAD